MTSIPPPDHESHEDLADAEDRKSSEDVSPQATVPPFSPRALSRSLAIDAALRWAVLAAVVFVLIGVSLWDTSGSAMVMGLCIAVVGGWIAISVVNTRATRELPRITLLIQADPPAAEDHIAQNLRRRPLLRWVRLMLHHRLAVLRHHQQRYPEAAAICQAVLAYPLGPGRATKPHLLLMLAEANLESGDAPGAWTALSELHRAPLGLAESLQREALRTRYEVVTGHDSAALREVAHKIELAELMPAAQCGAVHALLAVAAQRQSRDDLAAWLWARVELLCPPAQVAHMRQGLGGADES